MTISDASSRYLLRCQAVEKTNTERVRAIFEAAFREHGLPQAIGTDNGAPFASCALAGLSRLAVWWIKLGIRPERIEAGHPEQNCQRCARSKLSGMLPAVRILGSAQSCIHTVKFERTLTPCGIEI